MVVTRAADQAAGLAAPLAALGAEVVAIPVIEVAGPDSWGPADDAIAALDAYEWIVLTSANGVDAFEERLRAHGRSLADARGPRVAVVGSATAERLREVGATPALVPASFRAEGVVEAFRGLGDRDGARVLVARALEAREVLPDDLRAMGYQVDIVPVYRLVAAPLASGDAQRLAAGVDAVTFASGGTARRFVEVLAGAGLDPLGLLAGTVVASIGPVTSEALAGLGVRVDVEAGEATAEALADALARRFAEDA